MRLLALLIPLMTVTVGDGVHIAFGQPASTIDTLDWSQYVPLSVGNTWQYHIDNSHDPVGTVDEYFYTLSVVRDTTFDQNLYFVVETSCDSIYTWPGLGSNPCASIDGSIDFFAYDSLSHNVFRRDGPDSDSSFVYGYPFALSAPFDTTMDYFSGAFTFSKGEHDYVLISGDSVFTTVKDVEISSAVPKVVSFAHGVGMTYSSTNEGGGSEQKLVYANVDGVEMGSVQVSTDSPKAVPGIRPDPFISVYPNPASSEMWVSFQGTQSNRDYTVTIFDILGRKRIELNYYGSPLIGDLRFKTDRLEAGTYIVVLTDNTSASGTTTTQFVKL